MHFYRVIWAFCVTEPLFWGATQPAEYTVIIKTNKRKTKYFFIQIPKICTILKLFLIDHRQYKSCFVFLLVIDKDIERFDICGKLPISSYDDKNIVFWLLLFIPLPVHTHSTPKTVSGWYVENPRPSFSSRSSLSAPKLSGASPSWNSHFF